MTGPKLHEFATSGASAPVPQAQPTVGALFALIKAEEDTLCSLPYQPEYKGRRAELTQLVQLHRAMLVNRLHRPGCLGRDPG